MAQYMLFNLLWTKMSSLYDKYNECVFSPSWFFVKRLYVNAFIFFSVLCVR